MHEQAQFAFAVSLISNISETLQTRKSNGPLNNIVQLRKKIRCVCQKATNNDFRTKRMPPEGDSTKQKLI